MDEVDERLEQLKAKAINVLHYSLDAKKFNYTSTCNSAKEIQNRFEVTYEGTNQVKEFKINMLVHKYELFRIKSNKSIVDMFIYFTDIINGIKSLEKSYPNNDLMRKIFRSLPRSWEAKVIAIQEAKDLNVFSLKKLLGSLMTHELAMKQHNNEKVKKKRTIALKSVMEEQEDEDLLEEDDGNEDMALIIKKFKKFLRRK